LGRNTSCPRIYERIIIWEKSVRYLGAANQTTLRLKPKRHDLQHKNKNSQMMRPSVTRKMRQHNAHDLVALGQNHCYQALRLV